MNPTDVQANHPDPDRTLINIEVDDLAAAKSCYADVLGVRAGRLGRSHADAHLDVDGRKILVYDKGNAHQPATCTVLNLPGTCCR